MRKNLTLLAFLVISQFLLAQNAANFWQDVQESQLKMPTTAERSIVPVKYRTLSLDLKSLKKYLSNAPMERTEAARKSPILLDFPMPDGNFETFQIWESPVMQPGLAARFPHIRSFSGRGKFTPSIAHLDYGDQGFHAAFRTTEGIIYIDPYAEGQQDYYIAYFVKDHQPDLSGFPALACGLDVEHAGIGHDDYKITQQDLNLQRKGGAEVDLRTYVLALSCTGEYAVRKGGTVAAVLSTFVTAVNRVNQVYETEVAIKFVIYDQTDKLIFLSGLTDPWQSYNVGMELLAQASNVFNLRIPVSAYDIGHVFTLGCTDVGGVAHPGVVCNDGSKADGITCHYNNSVTFMAVEVMAHEMGHQFSASHTFDNCPTGIGPGQRSGSGYEPGSGSTIMSYAGGCGNQSLQGNSDDYFHNNSVAQIIRYSRERAGSTCPDVTPTGNREPAIDWQYQDGFYIPIYTPFELTCRASDMDGDNLTYCWEEFDLSPTPCNIGYPDTTKNCPIYRSYPPTPNPTRVFPRLDFLVTGDTSLVEYLVRYARDFTFRCTVRDNHPGAGGTVWEQVGFRTARQSGPFVVKYPNGLNISWNVGDEVEVTWDVARSDQFPVNCKSVNIKLSLDGGYTYPVTLSSNTPNDGAEKIFVPNNLTTRARIRVEAADNIFFNISNRNFTIAAGNEPGYTFSMTPTYRYACLPENFEVQIQTGSVLGYDSLINLEIVDALPSQATAVFSSTQIKAGENATLYLSLENGLGTGELAFWVRAWTNGGDTVLRQIVLNLVSNDYSALAMATPLQGEAGVSEAPTFKWRRVTDAQYYDLQVAKNPAFGASDIIFEKLRLLDTTWTMQFLLDESTPYYWRVRPGNICGAGDFLTPFAFHTFTKSCKRQIALEGANERIPITGFGKPTVESTLYVADNASISDVNVPNIRGSYETVDKIRISLVAPDTTTAILFEKRCSGSPFNFGFDDQIASRNPCPAADGKVRGPQEFLDRFNGKSTFGNWKLRIEVLESGGGGGGSLEEWTLEFCGNLTPDNPFFVRNDTLPVPPGKSNTVSNNYLQVQDNINTPNELVFTLVTVPVYGKLYLAGTELRVGDQFRQSSIDIGNLRYQHNGDPNQFDAFTYTVSDGQGGWIATPQFNIKIDPNAVVGVKDPSLEKEIYLFPNPATDEITVEFGFPVREKMEVKIVNIHGQAVDSQVFEQVYGKINLVTSAFDSGVYFVLLNTEKGLFTKKLMIQR